MKLEDQVVSLELAKELEELGVDQESLFYWVQEIPKELNDWKITSDDPHYYQPHDWCSAFTVAELGEIIKTHWKAWTTTTWETDEPDWLLIEMFNELMSKNTEANARAKMLIHLLREGIVKPEGVER